MDQVTPLDQTSTNIKSMNRDMTKMRTLEPVSPTSPKDYDVLIMSTERLNIELPNYQTIGSKGKLNCKII